MGNKNISGVFYEPRIANEDYLQAVKFSPFEMVQTPGKRSWENYPAPR